MTRDYLRDLAAQQKCEWGIEDGTLNYLSIPAVEIGLRHLERFGIDTIQTRVQCLTDWLKLRRYAISLYNGTVFVSL